MTIDFTDKFILKYCDLFINRYDCYAIQDNVKPELFPTAYKKLTIELIKDSLIGKLTIGIHQIDLNNKIKWLCYDFDKKHIAEPKKLIDLFIKYLKEWYNLTGYIELSGSPDSYHIWIFIEPTDSEIAINFHKSFLDRLKSVGIDVKGIEKGISKGDKGLGCMIKLPFNIQRKNNMLSEFLADMFKIIPERLPVFQDYQHTHTKTEKVKGVCGFVLEYNEFADIETCKKIIAKNPKIVNRIRQLSESDRSGLDFLIIKCLAECRISKDSIWEFLKTVHNSKIHEKGYPYFQNSYDNVIKSLSTDAYYQNKGIRGGERTTKKDIKTKLIHESEVIHVGEWKAYKVVVNEWESDGKSGKFLSIERHEAKPNSLDRANSKAWYRKQFLTISNKETLDKLLSEIEKIKGKLESN